MSKTMAMLLLIGVLLTGILLVEIVRYNMAKDHLDTCEDHSHTGLCVDRLGL